MPCLWFWPGALTLVPWEPAEVVPELIREGRTPELGGAEDVFSWMSFGLMDCCESDKILYSSLLCFLSCSLEEDDWVLLAELLSLPNSSPVDWGFTGS